MISNVLIIEYACNMCNKAQYKASLFSKNNPQFHIRNFPQCTQLNQSNFNLSKLSLIVNL